MMHYLVPVYMTYICIEIFSGALRGCGDVRVPTIITLTWITATVLFAIYYAKGGWMQRCIAVQNAKTQG